MFPTNLVGLKKLPETFSGFSISFSENKPNKTSGFELLFSEQRLVYS
jgi:hypothetical protein